MKKHHTWLQKGDYASSFQINCPVLVASMHVL